MANCVRRLLRTQMVWFGRTNIDQSSLVCGTLMLTALPYPDHQDPDMTFVAVSVVCRSNPPIVGLTHVVDAINNFLPVHASWTLKTAAERGCPRLIKIMLAREPTPVVDMRLVAVMCNQGLAVAAAAGRLWVLEDFIRQFPGLVITHAAIAAAHGGYIHIMHWLHEQEIRVCWSARVLEEAVDRGHTGIVQFICNHALVAVTSHTLDRQQICAFQSTRLLEEET
jgi:hypothetical protein